MAMLPTLSALGVHWRLVIDSATALDATPVRPTVQAEVPGAFTFPGAQLNRLGCTFGTNDIVVVWLCSRLLAVTVTVRPIGSGLAAVTVNVAALNPTPTVTPAGGLSAALVLATAIGIALAAAVLRLTVQVADAPGSSVLGVQLSPLNCACTVTLKLKLFVTSLKLAIREAV